MSENDTPEKLLLQLVNCQRVGPPYRGWDLHVLDTRMKHVESLGYRFQPDVEFDDQVLELINMFLKGRMEHGWNVTLLGKAAKASRLYLSLPSVETLNPEIAKMTSAAKRNFPNLFGDRFRYK